MGILARHKNASGRWVYSLTNTGSQMFDQALANVLEVDNGMGNYEADMTM